MSRSAFESSYMLKTEQLKRHSLPMACLGVALHANGKFAFVACMDGVYQVEIESGHVSGFTGTIAMLRE